MNGEWQLRREICEIGLRMHTRGLVAGTDGNVSARLGHGRYLITPSGSCLGQLKPGELVVIDESGSGTGPGGGRPSSERWMHLAAYVMRPDVAAVIHAHPPTVIAMTLAGVPFSHCALPELILSFGQTPVTRYATPGTDEGAGAVREIVRRFDAIVLDRHGSLTVGKSLMDAYLKLEKLEHAAGILATAHTLGGARTLPRDEVAKLAALREQFGLGRASDVAPECLPEGAVAPVNVPPGRLAY